MRQTFEEKSAFTYTVWQSVISPVKMRLLKLIGGDEDIDKLTTKSIRSNFSNIQPSIRHTDYCSKCGAHVLVEEGVYTCGTNGCDELRYAGPRNMQHQKKLKCYFATVPVRQQLQEVLQRDGILQKICTNNISLTMTTYGVPLYNSSSVGVWPIFFIINDLPPSERFIPQNLIIWGLWQGCGSTTPCQWTKWSAPWKVRC